MLAVTLAWLAAPALAGPSGTVRVVDGDTFWIGDRKVRLFGIDAPEIGQGCRLNGRVMDCGTWSARAAQTAFAGRSARCDDRGQDRYGRTIARCTVGGQDMAELLVRSGAAEAYRRYSDAYVDAEKAAIVANRGIWQTRMARPEDHRAQSSAAGDTRAAGACAIKGNISQNGRIYHMPGQEHYERTRISTSRGERWFCSEAEARAAGWRRARR